MMIWLSVSFLWPHILESEKINKNNHLQKNIFNQSGSQVTRCRNRSMYINRKKKDFEISEIIDGTNN